LSSMLGAPEWVATFGDRDVVPENPRTTALLELSLALGLRWEERVTFIAGGAPARWTGSSADMNDPSGRPPIEIAVAAETAARMGFEVGDELSAEPAPLLVSGIYEPLQPDDRYWAHAYELAQPFELRSAGGQSTLSAAVYVNPLT